MLIRVATCPIDGALHIAQRSTVIAGQTRPGRSLVGRHAVVQATNLQGLRAAAPDPRASSSVSEAAIEGKWAGLIGATVEVDLAKENAAADDWYGADRFISREKPVVTREAPGARTLSMKIPSRPTQSSGRLQNK